MQARSRIEIPLTYSWIIDGRSLLMAGALFLTWATCRLRTKDCSDYFCITKNGHTGVSVVWHKLLFHCLVPAHQNIGDSPGMENRILPKVVGVRLQICRHRKGNLGPRLCHEGKFLPPYRNALLQVSCGRPCSLSPTCYRVAH